MEGDGMLCAQFHVDTRSDDPGPRCGHTLTCVPADGGGQRLIIFGGATALEGDGPSGSTSGIRLAGATSDVHSFDVRSGVWTKLDPTGGVPPPEPRTAPRRSATWWWCREESDRRDSRPKISTSSTCRARRGGTACP